MTATKSDVKRILGGTSVSDTDIDTFITAAQSYYDERLPTNANIPTALKDEVVANLAAHFIRVGPEKGVDSGGEGGGNVTFSGETSEGLKATRPGQAAISLDPKGVLTGSSKAGAYIQVDNAKGYDY